jgi:hypothetical protein
MKKLLFSVSMKHLFAFIFLCYFGFAEAQVTYYSQGGTFGTPLDWNDAATWNTVPGGGGSSGVPTIIDDVDIRSTHVIELSSNGSCASLTMRNTGLLEIVLASELTIEGDLNLFSDPDPYTPLVVGLNSKVILTQTLLGRIGLDDKEMELLGAGTLQIGTTGTAADYGINDLGTNGTGKLLIPGILAPVNGDLDAQGKVVLKATSSTNYGRVALNDGAAIASRTTYTGTITGNLIMENTLGTTLQTSTPSGGFYQGDWFQLSYPLQTADLSSGWSGITLNTTGVASTQNIWSWDATSSGNTQVGADFPDANGWTPAVNAEPNWDDKAYTVFLSSDAPFAASQTWSLTGTADLSDVTYDALIHNTADPNGPVATTIATDPAGWVLLRNPWPSNIETDSWFTSLSGGGVDDGSWGLEYIAVHVYNTIAGQYEGWTTSDITPVSSVDYNTAGGVADKATSATQNIPPFQAFWVKTSSASAGTLTLKKKFSTTAISSKVFQKTSSTLPETAVLMSYDEDSLRDITLVYYDNNKTNQFDMRGDIYKRMSDNPGWPNLYIEEAGNKAQSAGRPFKAVDTVEVYYESPKNNTMAHLWLNDTNIAAAYSIMLFDKLTQQTQNMRTNPSYSFTHNVNNNANRFQLILTNNSIGIEESDLDENPINIYATQDELVIESESYTGAAFITLYDMAGRRVMSRKIEVTEGVKMRTQLPTGMANALYTVEIEFDGRVVVEKIMR